MLWDHDAQLREWITRLEGKLDELTLERNRAQAYENKFREELRHKGRQIAAALESRDRYRAVAKAMSEEHQRLSGGSCTCGDRYPCPTAAAGMRADPDVSAWLWG
jgi:hypothetical protein